MDIAATAAKKTQVRERNAEVDFLRILMALVIAVHHLAAGKHPFIGGYLGVEFFFLLSGYFATEKALRSGSDDCRDALRWTWKSYCTLFPFALLSVAAQYALNAATKGLTAFETVKFFLYGGFEMTMLAGLGVRETYLNGVLWYVTAMLITLPFFYASLIKGKRFFLYVVCPAAPLLIYSYFAVTVGHIDAWNGWLGVCYQAIPRAWAGMCLGGATHMGLDEIGKWGGVTRSGKHMLSALELFCFGIAIVYMWTRRFLKLDFLCIGLLAVGTGVALSGKASIHSLFHSWWSKLAELSVAIYMGHMTVQACVLRRFPDTAYTTRLAVYLPLVLLYALLLWAAVKTVRRFGLLKRLNKWMFK